MPLKSLDLPDRDDDENNVKIVVLDVKNNETFGGPANIRKTVDKHTR